MSPDNTPGETVKANAWIGEKGSGETLKTALTAFLHSDNASARTAIDKLYAYLDILDRKASTLCTINSLLIAVNGLLVFRPPPSIDTTKPAGFAFWASWLLIPGVFSVALSLFTVFNAVRVNSMKWPFLHYYPTNNPGSAPFYTEIQRLCDVVSERTGTVQRQRFLTLGSIVLTGFAVLMICTKTWFC